jgi:hypothetical protein
MKNYPLFSQTEESSGREITYFNPPQSIVEIGTRGDEGTPACAKKFAIKLAFEQD